MGRRLAPIAAALTLLFVTSGLAASAPGLPRVEHNAADMARARSVLVRRSDLQSEFRPDPKEYAEPLIPHCSDYPGDRSTTTVTGEAKSTFTGGTPAIGSKTLFFKTPTDLDRYWALTVRKRFVTCDARVYATTRRANVKAKTLFANEIPLGPTGTDRAVAYRTITRLSIPGHLPWNWYQTRVFLRSGRGLSMLKIAEAVRPCLCYTSLARLLALRLIDANHG